MHAENGLIVVFRVLSQPGLTMTISEDFNLAQMFQYIHVLPCLEMLNPPAIPIRYAGSAPAASDDLLDNCDSYRDDSNGKINSVHVTLVFSLLK